MHVCYLFHREYPQNFSTGLNEYTTKLASKGVDVSVIAGRNSTSVPARETVDGVDVYRILTDTSTSVSIEPTLFALRALRVLDDICTRETVDILHLLAFPNLGLVLRPIPGLNSPPVCVADVRATAVRNSVFDAISRVGLRIQRRLVDRTIVIDERVARNVFGENPDVDILPLGVDTSQFHPGTSPELRASLGFYDDDIVFGYTGSLHPPRQLHRAIDVFEQAHKTNPAVQFLIVGDGAARSDLQRRAEQSDTPEAFTFTGEVPFEEVPKYVRVFDVGFAYVPDIRQYRDQPPLKTVEFLSAGLPVIATDTPGNRVFVESGENARVVPDNEATYVDAVLDFSNSPEMRESVATNARESVAMYDYDRIVEERLIPIYQQLLEP